MLLGLFFWAGKFLFTNWYNILIDISISGKTTSPSFSWTGKTTSPSFSWTGKTTSPSFSWIGKTTSPSFMVDGEVNLPEKSGVVTAEIIFTLWTNLFGSEDSWRLSLTDYTDMIFDYQYIFFTQITQIRFLIGLQCRHESYAPQKLSLRGKLSRGANDSWLWWLTRRSTFRELWLTRRSTILWSKPFFLYLPSLIILISVICKICESLFFFPASQFLPWQHNPL